MHFKTRAVTGLDLAKKFVRITDSMDNFHVFADLADAVDYGFVQYLGPDFGFCLWISSFLISQASP